VETTAQLAKDVKKHIKQVAVIEMWGQPLWAPGNVWYDVEDVKGDADVLRLQLVVPKGERPILEVVGPKSAKVSGDRLVVGEVRLLRWSGEEFKPPPGAKGPALIVR